eukprot:PhF_6_TR30436/c0_g1_i1/m.44680/K06947/GRC3, NOL9; polynucleotide 5'-hydroxyl-kinase GRC3/NOL9
MSSDSNSSSDDDSSVNVVMDMDSAPAPILVDTVASPRVSHHGISTRINGITHCVAVVPPHGMTLLGSYILIPMVGAIEFHGDVITPSEFRTVVNVVGLRSAETIVPIGDPNGYTPVPKDGGTVMVQGVAWNWVHEAMAKLNSTRSTVAGPVHMILLLEQLPPIWAQHIFAAKQVGTYGAMTEVDLLQRFTPPSPEYFPLEIPKTLKSFVFPKSSRIAVVGLPGSGKSQIERYLLNKFLLEYPEVIFVDVDVNQGGEGSLPGVITVTKVSKPCHGWNLHPKTAEEGLLGMWYVGDTSPLRSSMTVAEIIHEVSRYCTTELSDFPFVLNTHGICEGLGLRLTHEAIRSFRCSHIVHAIRADDANVCTAFTDPSLLADRASGVNHWTTKSMPRASYTVPGTLSSPPVIINCRMQRASFAGKSTASLSYRKDVNLLTYFMTEGETSYGNFVRKAHSRGEGYSCAYYISSLTPVAIRSNLINLLAVSTNRTSVSIEDIVGTLVGMRCGPGFRIFGLACVRNVDTVEGIVCLLSPLPLHLMKSNKIDTLCCGFSKGMCIPSIFRQQQLGLPDVLGATPTDEGTHHFSKGGNKKKRPR